MKRTAMLQAGLSSSRCLLRCSATLPDRLFGVKPFQTTAAISMSRANHQKPHPPCRQHHAILPVVLELVTQHLAAVAFRQLGDDDDLLRHLRSGEVRA